MSVHDSAHATRAVPRGCRGCKWPSKNFAEVRRERSLFVSSGVKPVCESEGTYGLGRTGSARIVGRSQRNVMANQHDRSRRGWTRRIERMRAIRQHQNRVHLRAQIDEISWPLAVLDPDKPTIRIERDRSEERHAGRNVAHAKADLGGAGDEILLGIARRRAVSGESRSRRRSADHYIVRAAGILDQ